MRLHLIFLPQTAFLLDETAHCLFVAERNNQKSKGGTVDLFFAGVCLEATRNKRGTGREVKSGGKYAFWAPKKQKSAKKSSFFLKICGFLGKKPFTTRNFCDIIRGSGKQNGPLFNKYRKGDFNHDQKGFD